MDSPINSESTSKKSGKNIRDRDIEVWMGLLLRNGVLLSACIVFAGAVVYLFQHGNEEPQLTRFSGEPERLTHVKEIFSTACQGRGRSIIQAGLLLLIATPVARIIFSIIGFLIEKDYLYVLITFVVLSIVLISLMS